jgi:hypothetical protein
VGASRGKWQAHVAEVRANLVKKKTTRPSRGLVDRRPVRGFALDAIAFALDAIDEAEYATLAAIYARANAAAPQV